MEKDISFEDVKRMFAEVAQFQKETAEQFKENALQAKETDRRIKEIGKQIGGIGERFGYFTEGLAINSLEKILMKQFAADHITPRAKVYDKITREIVAEYDVLAYCNSDINQVVVVEVKSTLKSQYVEKFEDDLNKFKALNPEHKDKKLYGIMAFMGVFDKNLEQYCHSKGIYTATIHNEIFKLNTKEKFTVKDFNS